VKFDKRKYKSIEVNWSVFEKGIHTFVKVVKAHKEYLCVKCSEEQITNGDLDFMTKHKITLSTERKAEIRKEYLKYKN
jgi:hypothetical protein